MGMIRHTAEIIDGVQHVRTFHKVVVHKTDSDPAWDSSGQLTQATMWYTGPAAAFVKQHSIIPIENLSSYDPVLCTMRIAYIAELEEKKLSEYYLKWGSNGDC
jgi:hypothetical protein